MLSIGAISRQTGINAETLRKWELRYGFPVPLRTEGGHRMFQDEDAEKIHAVVRAIAQGQRPGNAIRAAMSAVPTKPPAKSPRVNQGESLTKAIKLLKANDLSNYQEHVAASLDALGTVQFIEEIAIPLLSEVGMQWQAGTLALFREKAFASHLSALMEALSQKLVEQRPSLRPSKDARPVLLGLPAGESHYLALMLLGVMLQEAGVPTILFKSGLPASQLAKAAQTFGARAVALSCSEVCPKKLLSGELSELRRLLPKGIAMWVGGAGALQLPTAIEGIHFSHSMQEVVDRAVALMPSLAGAQRTLIK